VNGIFWFGYGFVYGLVLRKDTSQRKVSGVPPSPYRLRRAGRFQVSG